MTMKDFLERYFRQLHFNSMPDAVRRRFDSYVDKNDFIGDMKSWRDDLLMKVQVDASGKPVRDSNGNYIKDPNGKVCKGDDGHYIRNDVPDASEMDDESWARLYAILQQVFTRLSDDRDSLDKATVKLLDKFFGNQNSVFSPVELEQPAKDLARNFVTKFNALDEDKAYTLFGRFCPDKDGEVPSKLDFREFRQAISEGSYEKNPKIRRMLSKFIRGLYNASIEDENIGLDIDSDTLAAIFSGLNPAKDVTSADIGKLKPKIGEILKAIHDNDKIAADIGKYDNSKISGPLETAIKKTDYTGKITEKNYVPEKYEDNLNVFQRAKKNTKEWIDDKLGFFKGFHREHIYHNKAAETIMGVILAEGISPTNGLDAIVEKEKTIIEKLQGKQPLISVEYFKWMVAELKRLRDGGMKEAFKNATKEPEKMRSLAENLGKNSADKMNSLDESKREELKNKTKVAMELMSVMEYGTFHGKLIQAVNGTEFTVFSDKDLSINKSNEAIATITKGIDYTLKFALQLAAYGATAAANQIRRRYAKMNHTGLLEAEHRRWQAENMANKTSFENSKEEQDAADDEQINNYRQIIADTHITDISAAETELERLRNNETAANERLNRANENVQNLQAQEDKHQEFAEKLRAANDKVNDAQKNLSNEKQKLKLLEKREKIYNEYDKLTTQFAKKSKKLHDLREKAANAGPENAEKINKDIAKQTEECNKIQQQMKALLKKYSPKGKKALTDEALLNSHIKYRKNKNAVMRNITTAEKTLQDETNVFQELKSHEGENLGCAVQLAQAKSEATEAQTAYDKAHTDAETQMQNVANYKDAQSQIDFYEKQKSDRQNKIDNWDEENLDYYEFFMGYWDFLHTRDTKRIFKFSRKQVQKRAYSGEMDHKLHVYLNTHGYSERAA